MNYKLIYDCNVQALKGVLGIFKFDVRVNYEATLNPI